MYSFLDELRGWGCRVDARVEREREESSRGSEGVRVFRRKKKGRGRNLGGVH